MSNTTVTIESIEAADLSNVVGGKGWLSSLGKKAQGLGEVVGAVGAVGSAVPVLGETGIPEAVAATGGATWLLGKGAEVAGNKLHK